MIEKGANTMIRPVPAGDLTFVTASHGSMYGTIRSDPRSG
jgi:hypothetical protein